MLRPVAVFLFLLTGIVHANAQAGISIQASAGKSWLSFKSFNSFVTSYNKLNEVNLSKKLGNFGLADTREVEFSLRLLYFALSVNRSWSHTQSVAQYINSEQRVFDLKRKLWGVEFGFTSLSNEHAGFVELALGFNMGPSILDSYYVYPDGTISRGGESLWNGIYVNSDVYPYVALKTGAGFKKFPWIRLFAKGQYMFNITDGFDFRDGNDARAKTNPTSIPADIEDYVSKNRYDYKGKYVNTAINSLNLQVGLCFNLMINAE